MSGAVTGTARRPHDACCVLTSCEHAGTLGGDVRLAGARAACLALYLAPHVGHMMHAVSTASSCVGSMCDVCARARAHWVGSLGRFCARAGMQASGQLCACDLLTEFTLQFVHSSSKALASAVAKVSMLSLELCIFVHVTINRQISTTIQRYAERSSRGCLLFLSGWYIGCNKLATQR